MLIKFLTPLLTFKDVFGARKVTKVAVGETTKSRVIGGNSKGDKVT